MHYAKLRMVQFYNDFIHRYLKRSLLQYCEVDTDIAYTALVGESIDDFVTSALRLAPVGP